MDVAFVSSAPPDAGRGDELVYRSGVPAILAGSCAQVVPHCLATSLADMCVPQRHMEGALLHELQGRRRRRKWKRQLVAAHPLLLLLLLLVECLSIFQYHKKKYCQCLLQIQLVRWRLYQDWFVHR